MSIIVVTSSLLSVEVIYQLRYSLPVKFAKAVHEQTSEKVIRRNCQQLKKLICNVNVSASIHFVFKGIASKQVTRVNKNFWREKCNLGKNKFILKYNQCDQIGVFLKMLGNKVPCKRSPTILQQFWAIVKNCTFTSYRCGYVMGNFWRKLGYFLLRHLVTLNTTLR